MTLTFPKCSIRDYFIVSPDDRFSKQIETAMKFMLNSDWGRAGIVLRPAHADSCPPADD